jgi:hypothetical protein
VGEAAWKILVAFRLMSGKKVPWPCTFSPPTQYYITSSLWGRYVLWR